MLTDYFYPHIGGTEKVVFDLCHHLVSNGHEVCVFTFNIPKTKEEEIFNNIKIIRVKAWELTSITGLQSTISFNAWFKLHKVIKDFKPDIIHAHHQFFFTTLIGMLLKRRYHIPTVTTLHLGSVDFIFGIKQLIVKTIERIMGKIINNNSDLVIVGSRNLRENGIKIGIEPTKCIVIPNAVDLSFFKMIRSYSSNPRNVIFIGRLISAKGPDILIKSAKYVSQKIPDVKFKIVGEGPLKKQLQEYVKRNNLSKNITILGKILDIRDIMKESDLYVRPSLVDGMPYGILEAMAAGLPVIASDVAGAPDIITHGKTGYLIKTGSARELADAIIDLLEKPEYLAVIAKNGLNYVISKFGWQDLYKSYENCYQKLLRLGINNERFKESRNCQK